MRCSETFTRILPAVFLLCLATPIVSVAHEEETRVAIELESPVQVSAGAVAVEFQLLDTEKKKILSPKDLNVTHEKLLHLLVYDPALKEFQHVHPEFDGKIWKAELNFAVDGNYFMWVQGELRSESEEFSSSTRLEVTGGQQAWPSPVLGNVRTGKSGESVASLDNQNLRAGKMAMLTLKISREDGLPAVVTPYLGAFAHVISTPADGDSLIHVHPMNGSSSDQGMLHVTFPTAGFYRVWVQFIDDGVLKTVPLSVEVKN